MTDDMTTNTDTDDSAEVYRLSHDSTVLMLDQLRETKGGPYDAELICPEGTGNDSCAYQYATSDLDDIDLRALALWPECEHCGTPLAVRIDRPATLRGRLQYRITNAIERVTT